MRGSRPAELIAGSFTGASGTGLGVARRAAEAGIEKFQTLAARRDSEIRVGEAIIGRKSVRTLTGLTAFDDVPPHAIATVIRAKVDESIDKSLTALRRDRLDCVVLQRAQHRTAWHGAAWDRLIELLEEGIILSLGVAVQTPAEALGALSCADISHIQLPFNILDWRWRSAGVIDRLSERAIVTVHAHNIFLNGLLDGCAAPNWPRLPGFSAQAVIDALENTARLYERESIADLCLAYARGQGWIDGVIVEMNSDESLDANLMLSANPPLSAAECFAIETRRPHVALALLDPAQWPRK